ncbi:hypothetical protein [Occultella glacieicola]|uniref:hypothetical protein n=1 Tax=Occultella glacieicola TaxID=2518684 RepID=UPI0014051329|nr:hypothetical protein [Occultella glacieicola]
MSPHDDLTRTALAAHLGADAAEAAADVLVVETSGHVGRTHDSADVEAIRAHLFANLLP